jgi:hypothetical protein
MKYLQKSFSIYLGGDKRTKCDYCHNMGRKDVCETCQSFNKFKKNQVETEEERL